MTILSEQEQIQLLTLVVMDMYADTGGVWLAEVLAAVGLNVGWTEANRQQARTQRAAERVALMRQYRKAVEAANAPMVPERWLRRVERDLTLEQFLAILNRLPRGDTATEWTRAGLRKAVRQEIEDRIPF